MARMGTEVAGSGQTVAQDLTETTRNPCGSGSFRASRVEYRIGRPADPALRTTTGASPRQGSRNAFAGNSSSALG